MAPAPEPRSVAAWRCCSAKLSGTGEERMPAPVSVHGAPGAGALPASDPTLPAPSAGNVGSTDAPSVAPPDTPKCQPRAQRPATLPVVRKQYKRKRRACGLCKPNKKGLDCRWKPREKMLRREGERLVREARKRP